MTKIGWTYSTKTPEPVQFEYDGEFGYPNRTKDGSAMYINTHFRTKAEAWEELMHNLEARVSGAASERERNRTAYEKSTRDLADAAEMLHRARALRPATDDRTATEEEGR